MNQNLKSKNVKKENHNEHSGTEISVDTLKHQPLRTTTLLHGIP